MLAVITDLSYRLKLYCNLIDEISLPLKSYLKVKYLSFNVIHKELGVICFSNDVIYQQGLEENNLYDKLAESMLTDFPRKGLYLVNIYNSVNQDKVNFYKNLGISDTLIYIDIANSQNANSEYILQFSFHFGNDHDRLEFNYIDNLDLIKEFTRYFFKRFKVIINKLFKMEDLYSIKVDKQKFDQVVENSSVVKNSERNQFSIWLHNSFVNQNKFSSNDITKRESEILYLTSANNFTSKQVAQELNISKRTVDRHFENIRRKLNVNSKEEIIKKAILFKIIES